MKNKNLPVTVMNRWLLQKQVFDFPNIMIDSELYQLLAQKQVLTVPIIDGPSRVKTILRIEKFVKIQTSWAINSIACFVIFLATSWDPSVWVDTFVQLPNDLQITLFDIACITFITTNNIYIYINVYLKHYIGKVWLFNWQILFNSLVLLFSWQVISSLFLGWQALHFIWQVLELTWQQHL